MNEAEWDSCTDPDKMLEFLRASGKTNDRKLRLFAVACCRQVWFALKGANRHRAVVAAERLADGHGGPKVREARRGLKRLSALRPLLDPDAWTSAKEVPSAVVTEGVNALVYPNRWVSEVSADIESWEDAIWETEWQRQQSVQATLIRDLFPLRVVQVLPDWLHWNNSMAVALAKDIYRGRAFYRMPVLADVLEAAGCTNARLLGHLRGPGPHVRGCWALDLVLAKE